jgi:glutamate/tyrosine decarboxylase-like PLP-dependent enzyme
LRLILVQHMKQQQQVLSETFKIIQDYLESSSNVDGKVNEFMLPEDLKQKFDFELRNNGSNYDDLLDYIRQYLQYSVKTSHNQFLNQLFGGKNLPALLGEFITSLTNTSMYTYEVSPVATIMELEIVRKMNTFTGFNNGDGIFLTGGSNTNLVAMISARNKKFPETKNEGTSHLPKLTAFVSERSHFSFTKAGNAMGIGSKNVIKVKADALGRMDKNELEGAILQSIARGEQPFFIGATCGTTEMGAFDPLEDFVPIANKYDLWLHADGSWGGSAIMSPKYRHLFNGIESCDSFSWNPHKLMNIPLICSVLLVKDKGVLDAAFSTYDTSYIYHDNETSDYDLGPKSLQCGRRVDSLKLWLAWKYYGDEGYIARIEHLFQLAKFAEQYILQHPQLTLMCPTQSLNVNFRFEPKAKTNLDDFNLKVRNNLVQSGKTMVNYCYLNNEVSIRLILLNPDLTEADITKFFEFFITESQLVEKNLTLLV